MERVSVRPILNEKFNIFDQEDKEEEPHIEL